MLNHFVSYISLTFCLQKELLYNNHTHIDGTKITALGFEYEKPKLSVDQLRAVSYSLMKYFEVTK